jgi:hypothetical protein
MTLLMKKILRRITKMELIKSLLTILFNQKVSFNILPQIRLSKRSYTFRLPVRDRKKIPKWKKS